MRYFQTKREAEEFAKRIMGRLWKKYCRIGPSGSHRGGGRLVEIYFDGKRGERNRKKD